jgi:AbrB family looped-hinge helix DNA binding protein
MSFGKISHVFRLTLQYGSVILNKKSGDDIDIHTYKIYVRLAEMSEIMTVSAKGQITIPARVRAKCGIKTGDKVLGEYSEGSFIIKKPVDFFSLKGCFSGGKTPDDEEDLLTQEMGKAIMERE